jgi:hypothetical protein
MHMFDPLCDIQVIYRALTQQPMMGWYFIIAKWPNWIDLGNSTVFSWAHCHSWYHSDYMHRSLINNLNHKFFNKTCQDCLDLQNTLFR